MKRILLLLVALVVAVAARAGDDLESVLDRHLRADVAYWVDEPRLVALVRDNNTRNATLGDDEVRTLDSRWQAELDAGDGELTGHVMSRFASQYLAEVALRMDGAYASLVVLDNRGLVAAASDLPAHYFLGDDNCVAALASHADAPWTQDRMPATGALTRVAVPLKDPQTAARIGTLLLDVDVARLVKMKSIRAASTRREPDAVTARADDAGNAARN